MTTLTQPLPAPARDSSFTRIGGMATLHDIARRFYFLVDSDPDYAQLRALHGHDLGPVRESLALFLAAWMGAPEGWFRARPDACIFGLHRGIPVTAETADQWAEAMRRAIEADPRIDPDLGRNLASALDRLCRAMAAPARRRPRQLTPFPSNLAP